ncbi:MAG: Arc family DNA-binding protein [Ruminococcus sp.]|nr:Arc family DNA-binding protein [Ruminococcus sp.]
MDKYKEARERYLKEKVDEFKIRVPKGQKVTIQEFAKSKGKSLNSFVLELINKEMNNNS